MGPSSALVARQSLVKVAMSQAMLLGQAVSGFPAKAAHLQVHLNPSSSAEEFSAQICPFPDALGLPSVRRREGAHGMLQGHGRRLHPLSWGGCSALLQDQPHVVAPLGQHNSISKEAGAAFSPPPHPLGPGAVAPYTSWTGPKKSPCQKAPSPASMPPASQP